MLVSDEKKCWTTQLRRLSVQGRCLFIYYLLFILQDNLKWEYRQT